MTATLPTTANDAVPTAAGRSRIGWRLGAVALVLGAAGNTAQAVLSQVIGDRPEGVGDQITLAQDNPTLITAMAVVGLVAVPFMLIGFLAAAQELARRAGRTASVAAALLSLGMWGFLGIQVAGLLQIRALLAEDGQPAAEFLNGLQSDLLVGALFGIPFFAGCVLGVLTLTIALLIKGGLPRWIPGAWLVFIVWDFTIGRIGLVDPHWLYLAGAIGLSLHLIRRDGARTGG